MNPRSKLKTAVLSHEPNDGQSPLPVFDSSRAMELLFRKAKPHMSRSELSWLAESTDYAWELATNTAESARGIAVLVKSDLEGGTNGSFQAGYGVPDLIRHFAGVFDHISGLIRVAEEAQFELRHGEGA